MFVQISNIDPISSTEIKMPMCIREVLEKHKEKPVDLYSVLLSASTAMKMTFGSSSLALANFDIYPSGDGVIVHISGSYGRNYLWTICRYTVVPDPVKKSSIAF
jgi:hypothetical protein